MNELAPFLSQAYQLHEVERQPAVAVQYVRSILSDPDMRAAAERRHQDLGAVVAARTIPGQGCGCHVSKIQHEILSAALQESLNG